MSLVHGFTHDKSVSAAGLAQSVERLTAEREVAGSIPGAGPILGVLKKPVSVKRRLRTADCRLRTRGKMQTECKMQTESKTQEVKFKDCHWCISIHFRVVTWHMGSGLKAQNMTGIRAQRKGLRAQKNGIRDHKAFQPESDLLHGLEISYLNIFQLNKVCVHRISWPRYITYSCFRLAAVPVIRSPACLTKTRYHILNLLIVEGTVI